MNKTLKEDAKRIEQIMDRTVDRCDIWQDRFIYWIAVAIYHLIQRVNRIEVAVPIDESLYVGLDVGDEVTLENE